MKKFKKTVALGLAVAMAVGTTGCGSETIENQQASNITESAVGSSQESQTQGEEPMEVENISMYYWSSAVDSGSVEGFMQELMESYGVQVDVWAYSEDKTNAILASGDLPDVMYVSSDNLELMIDSGLVLELTDYLDQIPNLSKVEGIDTALNFIREFESNETGNLYAMPTIVGPFSEDGTVDRNDLKIYWEYYEAVGTPEFSNLEELIPILKEIQEKFPESKSGNKVYAMGTYYSPNDLSFLQGYGDIMGYGYTTKWYKYMTACNMVEGECEYLLEENGLLYECLTWLNQLYREGLFDPNSLNMARPDHQALINGSAGSDGNYILSLAESPGWNPDYMSVPFDEEKIYYSNYKPYGDGKYIVVNAETENLEGCLRFLNMLADPDAYLIWRSLPEGEWWYVEQGNVIKPTEKYLDYRKNGGDYVLEDGEVYKLWNVNPIVGFGTPTSYVDEEGNPRNPMIFTWAESQQVSSATPNGTAWQTHYDCKNVVELYEKEGIYTSSSKFENVDKFVEMPTESQQLMINSMRDIVVTDSWKMIYAESDAEFYSLWESMVADAEGLGAKDIYNWCCENINNAIQIRDSLEAK